MCGKVNRHSVYIWGTTNPLATVEHIRDSRKLNVCFFLPFRLAKSTDRFICGANCYWYQLPGHAATVTNATLQEIARTSFSNKTEPRHTSILTSVLTSVPWLSSSFCRAQTATLLEFLVPLTNCFDRRWFYVVLRSKPPLHRHS
jgi:hypothetical protein